MSIKNLQNDNNKDWLDVNFGAINAKVMNMQAGTDFNMDTGSSLELQGNVGISGDRLEKNITELIWVADAMGLNFEHAEFIETGLWLSTSATYNAITPSLFTTSDLGTISKQYILYYEAEIDSVDVGLLGSFMKVEQLTQTPTLLREWTILGNLGNFHNVSGFSFLDLTGINTFEFYSRTGGGASVSTRRIRYALFRID